MFQTFSADLPRLALKTAQIERGGLHRAFPFYCPITPCHLTQPAEGSRTLPTKKPP